MARVARTEIVALVDKAIADAQARGERLSLRAACKRYGSSTATYQRNRDRLAAAGRSTPPPPMHKNAGRPKERVDHDAPGWGLVSPAQVQVLLESLSLPMRWAAAAARAGIPPHTFADWRRKGRDALRAGDPTSPYARILLECEAARSGGQAEILAAAKEQAMNGNVAAQVALLKAYTALDESDKDADEAATPAQQWVADVEEQLDEPEEE